MPVITTISGVNADLVKERRKCTFDIEELTNFVDGGKQNTLDRREVEELVLKVEGLEDKVPEEYLSHKEKYENALRKACILTNKLRDHVLARTSFDSFSPTSNNLYRILTGIVKDVHPLLLHMGMFVPTIIGQCDPDQLSEWLPKALNLEIIGTYAQTELGHGTFLRGLETTATYDSSTEEFVLNSPTLTAFKWWPGSLGQTANHCVVVAQMYSQGVCHGIHSFLIQIRDSETHMPMSGIKVGEIGPKLGFSTANNGFLGFENYRIPRRSMLMKNSQILKDGTYIKSKNEKLTYGTMVFIRVMIVADVAFELARASTIAVRYSAVRHQSQPKPNAPEPQIIDYVTQQHKLFIAIAASHAFRINGQWLWDSYSKVVKDMKSGNLEQLPELHALACCLKAVSSLDATAHTELCRMACGGHGYMISSSLPIIYGLLTASVTYEGEYTVLMLQTARYLVKAWKQATEGKAMTETVAYMVNFYKNNHIKWSNTPEGIIRGFKHVAAGKTRAAYDTIQKHMKAGLDYEDAWNQASVQLVDASEAHCRAIVCEVYWSETLRAALSSPLASVLKQLAKLYIIYWALQKTGNLLMYSSISKADLIELQHKYEQLLGVIRPNAVGLVDGFGIRDEVLNSTLGAYDGRVYERLMAEAMKSPLNQEPVNQSFHKYLKPLMRGKL